MADHEHRELTRAFSGLGGMGVDEATMVSALSRWRRQPEKRAQFRKSFQRFFADHGAIEKLDDDFATHLAGEFSRFQNLMVLWAMHPWERDARWAHHALHKAHSASVVVEIACTRTAEELLGARRAYHALFHCSLEEDIAVLVKDKRSNLLVGLASAFRYEGPKVDEAAARAEAKAIGEAVKKAGVSGKAVESEEVVRILATRSKLHLQEVFKNYKEIHGNHIEEDLKSEECLLEAVQCLVYPAKYFSEVINRALDDGAAALAKDGLMRAAVSRSDVDMEEIRAAYLQQFGTELDGAVSKKTHGYYRDALLSLIGGK